ncbi:hypothetical protein NEOKW01_0127 [Nematocida sp. AWRm80]|nr:hypothetical protein NEOKW01_0127 [Nematocida sp. AWRm80]
MVSTSFSDQTISRRKVKDKIASFCKTTATTETMNTVLDSALIQESLEITMYLENSRQIIDLNLLCNQSMDCACKKWLTHVYLLIACTFGTVIKVDNELYMSQAETAKERIIEILIHIKDIYIVIYLWAIALTGYHFLFKLLYLLACKLLFFWITNEHLKIAATYFLLLLIAIPVLIFIASLIINSIAVFKVVFEKIRKTAKGPTNAFLLFMLIPVIGLILYFSNMYLFNVDSLISDDKLIFTNIVICLLCLWSNLIVVRNLFIKLFGIPQTILYRRAKRVFLFIFVIVFVLLPLYVPIMSIFTKVASVITV